MRSLYTETVTLIMVLDPLGNVPVILAILNQIAPQRRIPIILRESLFALIALLIFLFFGKSLLASLNIEQASLQISGGIILFLIAVRMIFPNPATKRDYVITEPYIVPIAIPMIAGPSALATVILLASQTPHHIGVLSMALFIAWAITMGILLFATQLRRVLGENGLMAMERLMGLLLTTVSVQMFLNGIEAFFKITPH